MAFPLLVFFLTSCSVAPHLQVSPVRSNGCYKAPVPLLWCGLCVCSPVPTQEWFAEDAFSHRVRNEDGGVFLPSLFSGGVQGSHWAARDLHPAGGNGSRLQLVSTECLGAGCVLGDTGVWSASPQVPACPVLCAAALCGGTCTQTCIKCEGSCVLFESCS